MKSLTHFITIELKKLLRKTFFRVRQDVKIISVFFTIDKTSKEGVTKWQFSNIFFFMQECSSPPFF